MKVDKKKYFELLNLKDIKDIKKNTKDIENGNKYNHLFLKDSLSISTKSTSSLVNPKILFDDYSNSEKIAEGVYYDKSKRTKDGGVVRALFIDTSKVDVKGEFNNKGKSISKNDFIKNENFIAAINGQFFGNGVLIGDIKSEDKIYLDSAYYDKISDKRYFISISDKGDIHYGKSGLEENYKNDTKFFIGGLLRLYDKDIVYKDSYSGDSQNSSISRTFIGIDNNNKLSLITIGEGSKRDKGASFDESIKILKSLGIKTAFILDGGGSTNMIIKNKESTKTDGRLVNSYISIYKK